MSVGNNTFVFGNTLFLLMHERKKGISHCGSGRESHELQYRESTVQEFEGEGTHTDSSHMK